MTQGRRRAGALALILSLAGCSGVVLTEADRGQTRDVTVGTTFSISLPQSTGERTPEMKGTIIRFLGRQVNASEHRDVFQFKAEGLGEDILRIPASPADPSSVEFSVRIRVSSGSGEPAGVMHQR
jgi:hypothetical protein